MFWRKDGVLVSADGKLIRCDSCPCSSLEKGIYVFVDLKEKFTYTQYKSNFSWDIEQYRETAYPVSAIYSRNFTWVDTADFLNQSENGSSSGSLTYYYTGYDKSKAGDIETRSSQVYLNTYKTWQHDDNNWYFNFAPNNFLSYITSSETFYGDEAEMVRDLNIWRPAFFTIFFSQSMSGYRTKNLLDSSFAYRYYDFYRATDWSVENFTINQKFIPFQLNVAPYGTQIIQYSWKINVWTTGTNEAWSKAIYEGSCKETVNVNLRAE